MLPIGFFIHKSFTRSPGFVRILRIFMCSKLEEKHQSEEEVEEEEGEEGAAAADASVKVPVTASG